MSSKELATVPANDATLAPVQERWQYAKVLASSSLIPYELHDNPANVLMVIDYGLALGIPTMQAVSQINIIKGKPAISPSLMSAVVRRAGHKLRIIQKDDPLSVTAELTRADDPDFTFSVTWTLDKAQQAGLYPGKAGSSWAKYPDQMLRARAISEVCRQGAEDALMGVSYVPEELESAQADLAPVKTTATVTPTVTPETPPANGTEPVEKIPEDRDAWIAFVAEIEDWTDIQVDQMTEWFSRTKLNYKPSTCDYREFTDTEWAAYYRELRNRKAVTARLAMMATQQAGKTYYVQQQLAVEDVEVEE